MNLVNKADYVKMDSKPAGARWLRRLGAAGFTARRDR